MKRLFAGVLSVFLLFTAALGVSVFAASNTYDLDELALQVTIPTGYTVVTRDTPASDPIFGRLGVTRSEIISRFEASSIYLNAISNTYNEEVVVTMTDNSIRDFNLLSDTVLNTLASNMESQFKDYGISISKYEIYQHSQAKFVKLYFTDTAKTVHGLQYYTVYDGKAMNFTMRSYEGSLFSRQETAIKKIVDSIKYDNEPQVSEPGEDTESFVYTDKESGVTFTVPVNWKQEALTQEREIIDVKFGSTKDAGCVIIYGSTDMWSQMSASERVGHTRADLNNSAFTMSEIAAMYNTTLDKVSTVTYNGIQYFRGEPSYSADTYGLDISYTMTQLIYIENGWLYTFQFGGTGDHHLYSDFESLLESVQYPTVSSPSGAGPSNDTVSGTGNVINNTKDSTGVIQVLVVLAVVAGVVAVVVVSHKKKAKAIVQTSPAQIYTAPAQQSPGKLKLTGFCRHCGVALPLDSSFCHMCGTEIVKE